MKRVMSGLAACLAMCVMTGGALRAADEGKPVKGEAKPATKGEAKPQIPGFKLPDTIALSDEQKEKLAAIEKEFQPQFAELKKGGDVLTDEQKAKVKQIMQDAKASGKTGNDVKEQVEAALNLTAEQKQKQAEGKQKAEALHKAMREKVLSVLTEDQRKALQAAKGAAKKPEGKPDQPKKPASKSEPKGEKPAPEKKAGKSE